MNELLYLYATANDDPAFVYDLIHFYRQSVLKSGVDVARVFVAISEIHPRTSRQERLLGNMVSSAQKRSRGRLAIKNLMFKSNVGRDFSSHAQNLRLIAQEAKDGDYVLFLNRSAFGPLKKGWYRRYIEQFERMNHVGICGSTINFCSHPHIESSQSQSMHVQTYAFLCSFPYIGTLSTHFPGEDCCSRLDVIEHGEYGISRAVLDADLGLTSLVFPDAVFHSDNPGAQSFPQRDIKSDEEWVKHLPFRYKFAGYRKFFHSRVPLMKMLLSRVKDKMFYENGF